MDWNEFIYQCWGDHAHNATIVAEKIKEKSRELKDPAALTSFVPLLVHVYGEHLGEWQAGIDLLKPYDQLSLNEEQKALLKRSEAILSLGINSQYSVADFSDSEQARIFATASAAYLGHEKIKMATELVHKALHLGQSLPLRDPAIRALAISTNNMASALQEKEHLNSQEIDFMLENAAAARRFWEQAGTWKEVERAEFRLAFTHLKAKMAQEALSHAQLCLQIIEQNGNDPFEAFFAYEALAHSYAALEQEDLAQQQVAKAEELFGQIPADSRQWCQGSLAKMKKRMEIL